MTKNITRFTGVIGITVFNCFAWITSSVAAGITGDYICLIPVMWLSVVSVVGIVDICRGK